METFGTEEKEAKTEGVIEDSRAGEVEEIEGVVVSEISLLELMVINPRWALIPYTVLVKRLIFSLAE